MGFAAGAILALALLGLRGTAPRPGHYSDWQRDEFVRGLQRNLVMNATVDENDINRLYDSGDLREIVRTCGQMEADGPFSGEDFEKYATYLRRPPVQVRRFQAGRDAKERDRSARQNEQDEEHLHSDFGIVRRAEEEERQTDDDGSDRPGRRRRRCQRHRFGQRNRDRAWNGN